MTTLLSSVILANNKLDVFSRNESPPTLSVRLDFTMMDEKINVVIKDSDKSIAHGVVKPFHTSNIRVSNNKFRVRRNGSIICGGSSSGSGSGSVIPSEGDGRIDDVIRPTRCIVRFHRRVQGSGIRSVSIVHFAFCLKVLCPCMSQNLYVHFFKNIFLFDTLLSQNFSESVLLTKMN